MMNKKLTSQLSCLYTTILCLITKREFRFYKSKDCYMRLQKPLRVIPLSSIIEVDLVKVNDTTKNLDHFYVKLCEGDFSEFYKINKQDESKFSIDYNFRKF